MSAPDCGAADYERTECFIFFVEIVYSMQRGCVGGKIPDSSNNFHSVRLSFYTEYTYTRKFTGNFCSHILCCIYISYD